MCVGGGGGVSPICRWEIPLRKTIIVIFLMCVCGGGGGGGGRGSANII